MTQGFYVSPSRISAALECPLKYGRRYVDKVAPTEKPSITMWAGDCQHQALEQWAVADRDVVDAHRWMWISTAPPGLVEPLQEWLDARDEAVAFRAGLADLVREIQERRPEIKDATRTKEYREALADDGGVSARRDDADSRIERWYRSDQSPWKPSGRGPTWQFGAGEDALVQFAAWWDRLGDAAPDIVHTEAKAKIILADGRYTLNGRIDAVYVWPDGTTEVVDYKRSGGRNDDLAHFVQAAAYALTCVQVIGIEPSRVAFHHLAEGERQVYAVRPGWTDRLVGLCERVERMHGDRDFSPTFRTCGWCEFRRLCLDEFEFMPEIEQLTQEAA